MHSLKMAVDKPGPSYWDGAAPPSSVLGVGAKVPSSLFGVGSLLALGNDLNKNPFLVITESKISAFSTATSYRCRTILHWRIKYFTSTL